MRWIFWRTGFADDDAFLKGRATAAKILAKLYPNDDPSDPPFVNAVGPLEQAELIQALTPFQSRRLDEAIHRVYRAIRPEEFTSEHDRYKPGVLAHACVMRLYGKGYPDVVVPYFRYKAEELKDEVEAWIDEAISRLFQWLPLGPPARDSED
jgi:hypothetical protein